MKTIGLIMLALAGAIVGAGILGALVYDPANSEATRAEVSAATLDPHTATHINFPDLVWETGCHSRYSEEKKADKFRPFKDKPAILTGEVAHIEGGKLGLKLMADTLTYDMLISFRDPKDIYDLEKGSHVMVAFIMRSAGGCFLPYTGDNGVILPTEEVACTYQQLSSPSRAGCLVPKQR